MHPLARAIPAFMRQSLGIMFQYRGEILLWAIWGVIYPAIATAMWSAAIAGRTGRTEIAGFGPREFAAYFLLTMIIGHFCTAWDLYEMGWQVRSGRMSAALLRPLLPIWSSIADNIAYKMLTFVVLAPIWIIVAFITKPNFQGDALSTTLGIVAAVLGATLNFLWGYNVAIAAFWITKMDAIGECWHGLSMFFGGRLAPLTVLPAALQWIAVFLPFKWFIWFPSATLMGALTQREILVGLLSQAAWLAGGLIVFLLTWRAGVRQYSAVGA